MIENKDTNSTIFFLVYQMISHNTSEDLQMLGIDVETIRFIKRIPINALNKAKPHLFKDIKIFEHIKLDKEGLKRISQRLMAASNEEELTVKLIEKGASHRMVSEFFTISKNQFSEYRKLHNVKTRGKRSDSLSSRSTKDETIIVSVLSNHMEGLPIEERRRPISQCNALLSTAELTQITIMEIWGMVFRAKTRGEFSWDEGQIEKRCKQNNRKRKRQIASSAPVQTVF